MPKNLAPYIQIEKQFSAKNTEECVIPCCATLVAVTPFFAERNLGPGKA